MGAEDQQERLNAQWIAGFVDGEGCFYIGINRMPKMKIGWQVLPEFRVVQHKRDIEILHRIKEKLGCGRVKRNHGDRFEVRVRGVEELKKVISFFQKHSLQTTKRKNFETFSKVIAMMEKKAHLTKEGLDKIAKMASTMNEKVKPAYLVSSETLRQTSKR